MSKIIKGNCVLYDTDPRLISFESTGMQLSADDAGQTLSKNALDNADTSLRSALAQAKEILHSGSIDSKLAFLNSMKDGNKQGREDGFKKGRSESSQIAAGNVRAAAREFTKYAESLDAKYLNRLSAVKADCLDFAFGLAENILGISIDRDREDYKELADGFLCRQPGRATLVVDGCSYPFETLQTDGLSSCADGLRGVLVCTEVPCAISDKTSAAKEQELTTANEQTTAGEQKAGTEQPEIEIVEPAVENSALFNEQAVPDSNMQNESRLKAFAPEFSDEHKQTDRDVELNEQGNEADVEIEQELENENKINTEKFVFVRPSRKSMVIAAGGTESGELKFDDFARLGQDSLKIISRKAEIKDIASALSGASDEVTSALMDALPRRIKGKVLDAIKYLGPAPQTEIDDARGRLVKLTAEALKAREGDEADV